MLDVFNLGVIGSYAGTYETERCGESVEYVHVDTLQQTDSIGTIIGTIIGIIIGAIIGIIIGIIIGTIIVI